MTTSVSPSVLAALVLFLLAVSAPYTANGGTGRPTPKVIPLTSSGKDITPVLTGPPETVTMKSGFVVLPPGKSVGKHNTEQNEELLVVFEGQGEMTFRDGSKLPVRANTAIYCPPQTEHNVTNTGNDNLRYLYIVSNAR